MIFLLLGTLVIIIILVILLIREDLKMDAKYYDSIRRYQKAHGSITLPFYEKKMTTQQADVISFEKYKKNRKFTHKADAYATIERLENRERIKKRREEKEERKKHNDKVLKSLGRK